MNKPFPISKDTPDRSRPEPPPDLWDQLAVLNERAAEREVPTRPADSFTTPEYAAKFGISEATALRRIRKMIADGQVQRHGNGGAVSYTVTKNI